MNKKYFLFLLLALLTFNINAKEIKLEDAEKVAKTKFQEIKKLPSANNIEAEMVYSEFFINSQQKQQTAFFVFNINQGSGFVIVSGDDKINPILGYNDYGHFNYTDAPRGLKKLFFQYKKGIKEIANDNNIEAHTTTIAQWQALKNGITNVSRLTSVGPLMTTEWSQRPNYNVYCPGGAPTGCVATAVAQIMKYYNHPAQGTGYHTYNHNDYGSLSANFGATTYDWSNMPNKLYASSSSTQKNAVSKLMYHIGIAIEMNYSPNGSGASSSDVPDALKDYFGYDNTITLKSRSSYSLTGWKNLLKAELDAARVVYHRGYCPDPSAGHAFVIDGYDANDMFHLNWGWSGSYNGFFEINNLNPGTTYTWNQGQGAIIGIKPAVSNVDLRLFSSIVLTPAQINFNQPFSVDVDIANYGSSGFTGRLKAAIFDSSENHVGDVQIIGGASISSSNYNSYTFSTTGMSITPGNYQVGIYADLGGGNWVLINPDMFTNPINATISSTNNLGLISDGNILVNPDPVKQNQSFQVEFDVYNSSTNNFTGQISMDIHELNGDWISEVDNVTRTITAGGTTNIVLNHTGVSLTPGTYEFVIWHKPTGGSWEIIEEGTYPNSRDVQIVGLDFSENTPDQYESNDTIINPYQINLNYVSNSATFNTSGANVHSLKNKDYFKIRLDDNYEYLIYARVYDNYNDGGMGNFTNDMIFNYYYNNTEGDYYDDEEMPLVSINNVPAGGKDFVFEIMSFYAEDIGTYMLEIEVIRELSATSSIDENSNNKLLIFPNPTKNFITINQEGYHTANIYSVDGTFIKKVFLTSEKTTVPLDNVEAGLYLITFIGETATATKKIEVVK